MINIEYPNPIKSEHAHQLHSTPIDSPPPHSKEPTLPQQIDAKNSLELELGEDRVRTNPNCIKFFNASQCHPFASYRFEITHTLAPRRARGWRR